MISPTLNAVGGLNHPLKAIHVHNDLVMHSKEGNVGDLAGQMTLDWRDNIDILRTDDHIDRLDRSKTDVYTG